MKLIRLLRLARKKRPPSPNAKDLDVTMEEPGLNRIPAEVLEMITDSLDKSDLCALRTICKQMAERTTETMHERVFSKRRTWLETSLMGSDLQLLKAVAKNGNLSKYVETIDLEDHSVANHYQGWRGVSANVWPRDATGLVESSKIGLASLNAMLVSKQLSPSSITICDGRVDLVPTSGSASAQLAKEIWEGADLALERFSVSGGVPSATINMRLSPESSGQGAGMSKLRHVNWRLSADVDFFWTHQFLYHTPTLERLELHMGRDPANARMPDAMFAPGKPSVQLKQCHLNMMSLSTYTVSTLLASSHHSLETFELRRVHAYASTWRKLLTRIAMDCPNLTSFSLNRLSEGPAPTPGEENFEWFHLLAIGSSPREADFATAVLFEGFDREKVPIQGRAGLDLKRKRSNQKLCGVSYSGPGASEVLAYTASTIVLSFM